MEVNTQYKPTIKIAPYMAGFIVFANQIGLGMLGYQRPVAAKAGHDAWISVIMAGFLSHLTVWVICQTLRRYPSADLYGIHHDVYGKLIGRVISSLYILYFSAMSLTTIRGYVEIVQSWMFANLATWLLGLILLFLAWYTIMGGIRVITGYAIIAVFLAIWLLLDLYFTFPFVRWHYLLPLLEADLGQLLGGAIVMAFSSVGYEILYTIYPYVQDKQRMHRCAQIGVLSTNIIYAVLMVITLAFFSEGQLQRTIWPTLQIKTVVSFPFLERFEFFAISLWVFVILPGFMFYIWSASKGCARLYGWNQKISLYVILFLIFVIMQFFATRQAINSIIDHMSRVSLYMAIYYPYLLFALVLIKQRWNRRRGKHADAQE